jgi:hypothetical protein
MNLSPVCLASIWSWSFALVFFLLIWWYHLNDSKERNPQFVYFNPQDYADSSPSVKLPVYAKNATFDPFITQYTGMAKVTIGLAAASISFGGINAGHVEIYTAKLLLAYSIAFALAFCILVINFYENYLHDMESYRPFMCAIVESSGLTSLFCFALGYWYWANHLT